MQFEVCRGLVKADVQDKKVFISINGPPASRRRLLAVIRSDIERINRDIRNLQPQEMVPIPDYPAVVVPYEKLLAMERQGIRKSPELVGGKMIEVDVAELLNGVRPEHAREAESFRAITLFISYSHKDDGLRSELDSHLKIMQAGGWIDVWHDRRIAAGDEWKKKIDDNLEHADIILLLLSPDFIASDYCLKIEAKKALERHAKGEAVVIPVILRPCKWQGAEFASLQALPKDGLPVTNWTNKDSAWLDVEEGIERVVEQMRNKASRF
jgi:internalin A